MASKWWIALATLLTASAGGVGLVRADDDESRKATIVVQVPEDAQIYFDGDATRQTGSVRTFVTPELDDDSSYTLRAEMERGGQVLSITKKVSVRPGFTTRVTFDDPAPTRSVVVSADDNPPAVNNGPSYYPDPPVRYQQNYQGFAPGYNGGYNNGGYNNGGYNNGGYVDGMRGNTANSSQGTAVHLLQNGQVITRYYPKKGRP